jgi:splicing factor 3A subunit 1
VQSTESTKYVISPITGEKIAVDKMAEHMRISLIDPKYRMQKEAMLAKMRDSTKAQVMSVSASAPTLNPVRLSTKAQSPADRKI